MMKKLMFLIILSAGMLNADIPEQLQAVYFNDVDDSGSAITFPIAESNYYDLDYSIDKKFISFLKTANSSIDMCFYQITFDTNVATNIIGTIKSISDNTNIKIRIIVDNSDGLNSAFSNLLNYSTIGSANTAYGNLNGIMHNKFCIIDNKKVWTGSWNCTELGTYANNNNVIILSNTNIAKAYKDEFNQMFSGDFASDKATDNSKENISIGDYSVSCYFSPLHNINDELINLINDANDNIYISMFSFFQDDVASAIIGKVQSDYLDVHGVFESQQAMNSSSYFDLLAEGMDVKLDDNPNKLHHKFIIIDYGKPTVKLITGSFNISESADSKNDENILVFENCPELAELYYEEFTRIYAGPYYTKKPDAIAPIKKVFVRPNPANVDIYSEVNILIDLSIGVNYLTVDIIDSGGVIIKQYDKFKPMEGVLNKLSLSLINSTGMPLANGIYIIRVIAETGKGIERKYSKLAIVR